MKLERIALAAAWLLFLAPFLVGTRTWPIPTFYCEWVALALGLATILALAVRDRDLDLPWISLGLFALALVIGVQIALGRIAFPQRSVAGILVLLWAGLLAAAGVRLRERFGLERVVAGLQIALAIAGFVLAITGLMQRFEIEVFSLRVWPTTMVGLVGQRNHLANLVSCGLASLAFLAAARRVSLATAALAAAPMLLALPLTGSRSIWAFASIALACALLRLERWAGDLPGSDRAETRRLATMAGAAFALLCIVQLAVSGDLGGGILDPIEGAGEDSGTRLADSIASGNPDPARAVLLRYGWAAFVSSPAIGVGFGELAWNIFTLAPRVGLGLSGVADFHCHNLVLQLLAETGVAGAACIVAPLLVWFARFPWRRSSPAQAWLLVFALVQIFQGLVQTQQWYAHLLGPLALVLGSGSRPGIAARACGATRALAIIVVALGAIPLAAALADYRALERWQRDLQQEQAVGRALSPELFGRLLELRASIFGWRAEGVLAQLVSVQPGEEPDIALAFVEHAMRGQPTPILAERYAQLLDQGGHAAEARKVRLAAAVITRPAGTPATP